MLIVEDEECAFWLMDSLVNHILPDYYSKDMIGLRADTRALGQLVDERQSDVAQVLETVFFSIFLDFNTYRQEQNTGQGGGNWVHFRLKHMVIWFS